ncbi:extensin family protein [Methylobacterium radiodurans]|uniref:Extensin n=1 Tax=Methylobacterium radiodurans TaxID=2202828 RepID=A0A2U8VLI4_9HYPH|nr:extensin family protein [Methylobacterium radiodurans]AWN34338.1 extensin [Methylobacterium radiodurans]
MNLSRQPGIPPACAIASGSPSAVLRLAARTGTFGALALALFLAAPLPGRAAPQDAPAASVPLPPPVPPERPQELTSPPPPGAMIQAAPTPPERPAELKADAKADAKSDAKSEVIPETPEAGRSEAAQAAPLPPARPPELSGEAALALKVAAPDDTACRTRLTRLGARFEPLPAIANGQCGAPLPLKLTALDGIALPQAATLTCTAAEALARWATEAQVAAERELKQPLRSIAIGTSYECRGQNHAVEAKLSEHAFANGIDVMSFGVEGRASVTVASKAAGSDEGRFLDAVRGRACAFFRTVLGPGSNAAHANHLHLDERERSAGHRLCQ